MHNSLPDEHRAPEPPDPIPNSEVKRCIADGSVGFPHVRVGHRQALILKKPIRKDGLFFGTEFGDLLVHNFLIFVLFRFSAQSLIQ